MLKYMGETNAYFAKGETYKEILLEVSDWRKTLYTDIAKALDTTLDEAHRARVVEAADGSHVLMTVQQALENFSIAQKKKPIIKLKENLEKESEVYLEQRRILQDLFENYVAYTNLTFWYGYEDERDDGFDIKVAAIVEEDNESFRIEFYNRTSVREKYWIYMNDFLDKFEWVKTDKNGPLKVNLDYNLHQDYVEDEEE